jgi:hypothetical protein
MANQCHTLKIEMVADRCKLRHDGIEGVGEISLFPGIGGGARRLVVRGGHGRRCASGGS